MWPISQGCCKDQMQWQSGSRVGNWNLGCLVRKLYLKKNQTIKQTKNVVQSTFEEKAYGHVSQDFRFVAEQVCVEREDPWMPALCSLKCQGCHGQPTEAWSPRSSSQDSPQHSMGVFWFSYTWPSSTKEAHVSTSECVLFCFLVEFSLCS